MDQINDQQKLIQGQQEVMNHMKDDEFINPEKEYAKEIVKKYDLNKNLSFEIKALNKIQKFSSIQNQYIPAMISLKANETYRDADNFNERLGVDLICLIDRSDSMKGQKIEMVKKTLKVLLNFLGAKDRLQLIIFNDKADRITPLKCTTEENRSYFEQKINQISVDGGTDIYSAIKIAFQQLKDRQYRNYVTSMFLLSDGQDDQAYFNVKSQISQIEELFTLHTFGFGKDNDDKMMTSITNLKDGSFYFVSDINLLDRFFVDALNELISVVGEKISIQLKNITQSPFQDIKISKTFGTMWNQQKGIYQILIPQLSCGKRKEYVFELLLPQINYQINDNQRNVNVIEAQLTITDTQSKQVIQKQDILELVIFNENEESNQYEDDIDVYCQYFRVKGTDVINSARQLCENNQNDQALILIQNMLVQIRNKEKVALSDQCQGIIQDLEQALSAFQTNKYHDYGRSTMCEMVNNNYIQKGANAQSNFNGQQIQQRCQGQFQNYRQIQMMQYAQSYKQPPQNNFQNNQGQIPPYQNNISYFPK